MSSCEDKLTRELEEEKSYTRNAMERYRKDPHFFKGEKGVLENWSRMDYVAIAVSKQGSSAEPWAKTADQLSYVEAANQRGTDGKPYCVIRTKDTVTVIGLMRLPTACAVGLEKIVPVNLRSGDLDFYSRNENVYVLRESSAAR
jgi:hypothetical protein